MTTSSERTITQNPGGIASNLPGNWTAKNINFVDVYSTISDLKSCWMVVSENICIVDDDLPHIIKLDGLKLGLNNTSGNKLNVFASDTSQPHYRRIIHMYENIEFNDYFYSVYPSVFMVGTFIDEVYFKTIKFTN